MKFNEQSYLIHYGELGLKGKNRINFEQQLVKNIKSSLNREQLTAEIELKHKLIQLTCKPEHGSKTQLNEILGRIFGISWFAKTETISRESNLGEIAQTVLSLAKPKASPKKTFRVTAKRADKRYLNSSKEIEELVGQDLLDKTDYKNVDLGSPDHTYFVEVDHDQIYVFDKKFRGAGGLPVDSSGRTLVLLSGGIDSPVAAWTMAKRGCAVDFLHFYVDKPDSKSKITRLSQKVSQWSGSSRLFTAPYLPFNLAITEIETEYELVLFRRFMMRVAERLCERKGIDAIATGDSLGQVASQTISNITAANDALESRVCFRPLLGYDKQEIISIAKKIGTFEVSNKPGKDCCSIIDRHAKTRVGLEKIRKEEGKFEDLLTIIDETIDEMGREGL